MNESLVIRPVEAEDRPFILNSWLNSYFDGSSFARLIPRSVFFPFHKRLILSLLDRASVTGLVVTSKEDPELLYGYGIFELLPDYQVVHYLYVKRAFGKLGIASQLVDDARFTGKVYCTHSTGAGSHLIRKKDLIYCPYLIS